MSQRFELLAIRGPSQDEAFRELETSLDEGPDSDLDYLREVFADAAERWPDERIAGVFYSDTDDWLLMTAENGTAIETFLDVSPDGQPVDPSGEYTDVLGELGPFKLAFEPPPPEELPEIEGTDNPLRVGTRTERLKLARKADAFPSKANLVQLVEARFAPEHRANRLGELRGMLDRAIGRHEESAIARAIDDVLERGEPGARNELKEFVASTDTPAAVLKRLADSS